MTTPTLDKVLPVFPLTGSLLLPGTYLPLNVFEQRYRNLVEDALAGERLIGMVQPLIPGLDNWGVPALDLETPELYPVGCCGRIEQHELQPDGRHLIVLEGTRRFRILEELEPVRDYRRVRAGLAEFESDLRADEGDIDTSKLMAVLDQFARQEELQFDPDLLAALSGRRLINTLSTALPFTPVEQQALLETRSTEDRADLLIVLMGIELDSTTPARPLSPPPTIH